MNKPPAREALKAYYAEADSWARDRQDALRGSRRVAWIVAIAAVVVAVFEAIALLFLMPLKTVVPYTLMVDRETGFVQELKPLDAQLVSGDAALTQSFLVQYVIAREGYDYNSLQRDYRKVSLWSSGDARSDYVTGMQAGSPGSPLALYPRSTTIDVRVKSVTSIGQNVAMVRYETRRHDVGGQVRPPRAFVVVIRYVYSGAPMSVEDRYVNPLGFQVLRYRRSVENLAPPDPEPVETTATTVTVEPTNTVPSNPAVVVRPNQPVTIVPTVPHLTRQPVRVPPPPVYPPPAPRGQKSFQL